jgi:hypothetical protein
VKRPYVPDSGDVIWLTFDPQAGRAHRLKVRLELLCAGERRVVRAAEAVHQRIPRHQAVNRRFATFVPHFPKPVTDDLVRRHPALLSLIRQPRSTWFGGVLEPRHADGRRRTRDTTASRAAPSAVLTAISRDRRP